MNSKLSFGIACFNFGVKMKPPFRFIGLEYIENLRKSLQSISNINKISINSDEEFEKSSVTVGEELPKIDKNGGFFPHPIFMNIEFETYIPLRIQAQLLEIKEPLLQTFTENFKVSIHHTYHFPVTFIEPINPRRESTPSDAVIIVRKFLEQEFKNNKSDYIYFEDLGPSPFHIDCYIETIGTKYNGEQYWEFQAELIPQKGYDRMIFKFNQKIFKEANEAKYAIMEEIGDELGFFYDLVQSEVTRWFDWEPIQNSVTELITVQRTKGVRGFWKKCFVRSKLINEVFTALEEFESKDLVLNNITQRDYRDVYLDRENEYFKSYIDKQIKERFCYPTEQISKLVSFFEGRRIKSVEIFVILMSAIVGGGIGALLTILLST